MSRWHPAIIRSEGSGGNDPGAVRTLTLPGGDRILEALEAYDPVNHGYVYRIEQVDPKVLPVTHYRSSLSVTPDPAGGSLVTWSATFERGDPNSDPAPELNDEVAVETVTGVYEGGLANLRSRLEQPGK